MFSITHCHGNTKLNKHKISDCLNTHTPTNRVKCSQYHMISHMIRGVSHVIVHNNTSIHVRVQVQRMWSWNKSMISVTMRLFLSLWKVHRGCMLKAAWEEPGNKASYTSATHVTVSSPGPFIAFWCCMPKYKHSVIAYLHLFEQISHQHTHVISSYLPGCLLHMRTIVARAKLRPLATSRVEERRMHIILSIILL